MTTSWPFCMIRFGYPSRGTSKNRLEGSSPAILSIRNGKSTNLPAYGYYKFGTHNSIKRIRQNQSFEFPIMTLSL